MTIALVRVYLLALPQLKFARLIGAHETSQASCPVWNGRQHEAGHHGREITPEELMRGPFGRPESQGNCPQPEERADPHGHGKRREDRRAEEEGTKAIAEKGRPVPVSDLFSGSRQDYVLLQSARKVDIRIQRASARGDLHEASVRMSVHGLHSKTRMRRGHGA